MMNPVQFVLDILAEEQVSGEFMMSSAVQHAIVQVLMDASDSLESEEKISKAIYAVMEGLSKTEATWNEFLVGESTRGFVLGLTSFGVSTDDAVRFAVLGVNSFLQRRSEEIELFNDSIVMGVIHAGEDMGLKPWQLRRMLSFIPLERVWVPKCQAILQDTTEAELAAYLDDLSIQWRFSS
ncbi:MAG: hypothetical protein JWN30_2034 [Bacilli bacterium]|nr:hypothetical protein [Bacilli bacterium]